MAIDETLAGHVRVALADAGAVREVKMFGGLGFMLNGNMIAASSDRGLLVRVGEVGVSEALARGAQPMIMNGRKMKGFVWVSGTSDQRAVRSWLRLAQAFVETLPAKKDARKAKSKTLVETLPAKKNARKSKGKTLVETLPAKKNARKTKSKRSEK